MYLYLTVEHLVLQVETVDDYDEYCHYVAGLVGLGLSKLFYASGLEDLAPDSLSNSMGLFLQVFQCAVNWKTCFPLRFTHFVRSSAIQLFRFFFPNYLTFSNCKITCFEWLAENKYYPRLLGGYK